MCWSYNVSLTFFSIELALIVFLSVRSRISTNPFVRKQWLLLPALVSICAMEGIESYIWSDDSLISVQDTANDDGDPSAILKRCSKWNHLLTVFTWLFILPFQPLWAIIPCRRVGNPENRLLLQVPEFLAIISAVANVLVYLTTCLFPGTFGRHTTPLVDSNFKSYFHTETCTYLGASGHHLQWTFAIADTYLTPNAFSCSCPVCCLFRCRFNGRSIWGATQQVSRTYRNVYRDACPCVE